VRRLSLIRRHPKDGGERFIARMLQLLARPAEAEELLELVGAAPVVRPVHVPAPEDAADDAGAADALVDAADQPGATDPADD
jgi:hypothetical protein